MTFTHGHALLIGIGTYLNAPGRSVSATATDAHAIARIVQDPEFCGYPTDQVALLTEAGATRSDVLTALERLAQTGNDDTVLLFYSGHGDYDTNGSYTLTTHDTRWQGGRVAPGTGINQTELLTRLRAIPAERVLLLFNACHAGALSPTLGDDAPPTGSSLPRQTANALLSTGSGRIVITACRENQVAFVGTGEHTLFVQALVEGLRGGGEVYNRNGYISAFDLYTHVYYALDNAVQRDVPQHLRKRYGSTQEPELTVLKGVGPFPVALYRGATTPGTFSANHTPAENAALREVLADHSYQALQSIMGTAIVQGTNQGQNVGVNNGMMQNIVNYPTPPPVAVTQDDILRAFASANATLRGYEYTIADRYIQRSEVQQIITWVQQEESRQTLGVLLDQPGGGKTVLLRQVLEHLEVMNVPVLAIKADTLGDITTPDDLTNWLQLPRCVEECVLHLAETAPVVVLVDQLDALSLSLARNATTLNLLTGLIKRLIALPQVRVVASCRTFDWDYNPQLSAIGNTHRFPIGLLPEDEVARVLASAGIGYQHLVPAQQHLLRIPLHLQVFLRVVSGQTDGFEQLSTLQQLYAALWEKYLRSALPSALSAEECINAMYRLVDRMQRRRHPSLIAPTSVLDGFSPEIVNYLQSVGLLRRENQRWMFFHQTFFDYCYVRRFMAEGRILTDEVQSSPQGLFERSLILQVIAHLRETDFQTYEREIRGLLFADWVRNHLRSMVIDWLGALSTPHPAEKQLVQRLLRTPADWQRFLNATIRSTNTRWFDRLHAEIIPAAFQSNDEQRINTAIDYLRACAQERTDEVVAYLRPYLGRSAQWDAHIVYCLSCIRHWDDDSALELLCDFLRRDRQPGWNNIKVNTGVINNAEFYVGECLLSLGGSNPAGGCKAVGIYLHQWIEYILGGQDRQVAQTDLFTFLDVKLREFALHDVLLPQAVQETPKALLEHLIPWLIRIAMLNRSASEERYPVSWHVDSGWYGERLLGMGNLTRHLITALQRLAAEQPADFRALAQAFAQQEILALQRMLAITYAAYPDIYTQDIFDFLMGDTRRFNLGDSENPWYESCQLVGAVFPYLSVEQRAFIEQHILNLRPAWEKEPIILEDDSPFRRHGITQFHFLKHLPLELISNQAQRRKQELERKFESFEIQEPQGVVVGSVEPPIPVPALEHLSDNDWLKAMRAYNNPRPQQPTTCVLGGERELAQAFQERVKADPQRFYQLAHRFDATIPLRYITALIDGLTASDAPAEWLFRTIQRFAPRLTGELRRSACRAVRKHANIGVPEGIIEMLVDWALHDSDPGPETNTHDDLYQVGINANRSEAIETVAHCLRHQEPPQTSRALHLLAHAAQDAALAVRVCAIIGLGFFLPYAPKQVVGIVMVAVADQPAMLRDRIVHNFLSAVCKSHFLQVRPVLEAMLTSSDDLARQIGARLVCRIALTNEQAHPLAEQAMQGDAALRLGAAYIYAQNLRNERVQMICRKQLLRLLNDTDDDVLKMIGSCFMNLRVEHVDKLRSFIQAFLQSPALPHAFSALLPFLKQIATEEPALLLDAVQAIITAVPLNMIPSLHGMTALPLVAYDAPDADDTLKVWAMDVFEQLLDVSGTQARRVLIDWDRR